MKSWELEPISGRVVLAIAALTVTISYPVFPRIPPHSVPESPKSLFFLDLVAGFEPEGRGFESLPAYHSESST